MFLDGNFASVHLLACLRHTKLTLHIALITIELHIDRGL